MKRIVLLLLVLAAMFLPQAGFSQSTTTSSSSTSGTTTVNNGSNLSQGPNRWWWGVNMGATWQTSDIKTDPGFGWGITASKFSRYKENRILYWGGRFRFLDGRNYGEDVVRFRGLQNNSVLNGTNSNPELNYYQNGSGYLFRNYKMNLDELSFELMVGPNAPRKYGVLMYLWGGAGFAITQTKYNQLDAFGNAYNYSTIDTTQSKSAISDQLNAMWDDTYETVAQGSASPSWKFMPSAGIGIGKQFGQGFMIGAEHKITFTMDKVIDGNSYQYNNLADPKNDWYHYTGFYIKWRFNTRTSRSTNTTPPHTDHTSYTPQPVKHPPTVRFTTPNSNPYYTYNPSVQVIAQVTNVNSRNQLYVTVNNMPFSNYTFNASTGQIVMNSILMPGSNNFYVQATNADGSDNATMVCVLQQTTTVVTNPTNPTPLPPQVTITNPATSPYTSPTQTMTVNATVINVNSSNDIVVHRNGVTITGWSYNIQSKNLTLPVTLQPGSNLYDVVATNSVGSDAASVVINYTQPSPVVQPPVVTITNPAVCPGQSKTPAFTFRATIINVPTISGVTVKYNNAVLPQSSYTYVGSSGVLTVPVTLLAGNNTIVVTGTNTAGSDTKSCVVELKTVVLVPMVTITNPSPSPQTVNNPTYTFKATVINVNSQNEITVNFNNAVVSGWTYDMNSKVLTYPVTLPNVTNNITVTASNANGSDSKSATVVYRNTSTTPSCLPPTVRITSPTANPFITNSGSITITATAEQITTSSQVTVKRTLTGATVPFSFNSSTRVITINDNLTPGATPYTISVKNDCGSDDASITIKYVQSNGSTSGNTTNAGGSSTASQGGTEGRGNTNGHNSSSTTNTNVGNSSSSSSGNSHTGPPVITVTTPANNSNTSSTSVNVSAGITNVTGLSDIAVRVNGIRLMTGLSWSNNTLTFTASLNTGANTIEIQAQNPSGMDSETINVSVSSVRQGSNSSSSGRGEGSSSSSSKSSSSVDNKSKGSTSSSSSTSSGRPKSTTSSSSGSSTTTPKATTTSSSGRGGSSTTTTKEKETEKKDAPKSGRGGDE